MGQVVVETRNLTKKYNGFTAVDALNLRIEEGEIFGFLGPNGAGKTTTILMLLGLTEATSGIARVCGYDPTREPLKVKRLVGYLPERVGFYDDLTARQNLRYTAQLNGLRGPRVEGRIDEVLATVGIPKVADQPVGTFSRGMRQRLGIADIWIKEPKLAFLDEPTIGIDPQGIDDILDLMVSMARKKITVIFCSHLLHQVQKVCNRVGIIAKGRLVAEGSIDRLGGQATGGARYRIEAEVDALDPKLVESIRKIKGVRQVETSGSTLSVGSDEDVRGQISKVVVASASELLGMRIEEYNLEKIYKRYSKEA
jgi:ABC-2 type transport system ATP-binding protein